MVSKDDDIFCGLPWPPKYDPELDTTTPQGQARQRLREISHREYEQQRARYYAEHVDEVDIDSLVDDHYAALVEHHAGHGPYPVGPLFTMSDAK